MIKSQTIEFFQSWKKVCLNFVPGINVITGASDQGKSAIIKNLIWNFFSEPSATSFQSDFAGKDDVTSSHVVFDDDSFVTKRRKDNDINEYLTPEHNGKDSLRALKTGVPEEVKEITKIEKHNVQRQHDTYFLLQNISPGNVAKEFNHVAKIDIIDSTNREIRRAISDTKLRRDDTDLKIRDLSARIKKYDHLEVAELKFNRLEKTLTERDTKRKERSALIALADQIEILDEEIRSIDNWLEVEKEIEKISDEAKTLENEILEKDRIEKLTYKAEDLSDEIRELEKFIKREDDLLKLKEMCNLNIKDRQDRQKISELIEDIDNYDEDIEELEGFIEEKEKEKKEYYKELKSCPTCDQSITPKQAEKISLRGA